MAIDYRARQYKKLPRGLPRQTCKSCGNTYIADPDEPKEEPCGVCWVINGDKDKPEDRAELFG